MAARPQKGSSEWVQLRQDVRRLLESSAHTVWGDPEGDIVPSGPEPALEIAEEAFELAKTLLPEPELLLETVTRGRFAAARIPDWPAIQRLLEKASAVLDGELGASAPAAEQVRLELVQLLRVREQPERALEILHAHLRGAAPSPLGVLLEAERVGALLDLGRVEDAAALARVALRSAAEAFGTASIEHGLAASTLALALAHAGAHLDEALALARGAVRPPRGPDEFETHLRSSHALARVLLERGELDEALGAIRSAFSHVKPTSMEPTASTPWSQKLSLLWAEVSARQGELHGAAGSLRFHLEQIPNERRNDRLWANPELLPFLELLAKLLREVPDPEDVVRTQAKYDKIRLAVTGKPPPVRALVAARRPPQSIKPWPRRERAGVFTLRGVDRALADELAGAAARACEEPGPVHILMSAAAPEATLLIPTFQDPWRADRAERTARFEATLAQMVEALRSEPEDPSVPWATACDVLPQQSQAQGSGAEVQLVPWWAISDTLDLLGELSKGDQERWRTELFPTLPGWIAGPGRRSWFGNGILLNRETGLPVSATPMLAAWFPRPTRVELSGTAPAHQLDSWFEAFERATGFLGPEGFTPLSTP